jgi:hypothetical protein
VLSVHSRLPPSVQLLAVLCARHPPERHDGHQTCHDDDLHSRMQTDGWQGITMCHEYGT